MVLTPDGASFIDWIDNPRPTYLKPGEDPGDYIDSLLVIEDDFYLDLHDRIEQTRSGYIKEAIRELRHFRKSFNDDKMIRFQKEVRLPSCF